jgi:hypothetical protein
LAFACCARASREGASCPGSSIRTNSYSRVTAAKTARDYSQTPAAGSAWGELGRSVFDGRRRPGRRHDHRREGRGGRRRRRRHGRRRGGRGGRWTVCGGGSVLPPPRLPPELRFVPPAPPKRGRLVSRIAGAKSTAPFRDRNRRRADAGQPDVGRQRWRFGRLQHRRQQLQRREPGDDNHSSPSQRPPPNPHASHASLRLESARFSPRGPIRRSPAAGRCRRAGRRPSRQDCGRR